MPKRSADSKLPKWPRALNKKTLSRGRFLRMMARGAAAAAAAPAAGLISRSSKAQTPSAEVQLDHEALVVGSGIGGSVAAARLARRFGAQVLLVERGRRYPKGSFPREVDELTAALRNDPGDDTPRLLPLPHRSNGLLDLRSYDGMDVLVANGYGGGSLLYAAGLIEPEHPAFDASWPSSIQRDQLAPYWEVFRQVLQAAPVPITDEPERQLNKLRLYQDIAQRTGTESKRMPLGISFGPDPENPSPMGSEHINAHGAAQESCRYCAECVVGCNYHAKSSTDLNYLFAAEHRHGLQVVTETEVDRIVPLDAGGEESTEADGSHGYRVWLRDVREGGTWSVTTRRLVLSAGALGSTEILLRNRDLHGTLPRVSAKLGKRFSGNGDFLGFVLGTREPSDGGYGPTVTQSVDYNDPSRPSRSYIMEDMSLPPVATILTWLFDTFEPDNALLKPMWRQLRDGVGSMGDGRHSPITAQVFVGLDASDGELSLGSKGGLRLRWSYRASRRLYDKIIDRIQSVRWYSRALAWAFMPTYVWPLRRNLTVHPLGGAALADSPEQGVTSADPANLGEVFGYRHLYVADGSLLPSSLGANPGLTIGALSEMVCEGITGQPATAEL